MNAQLNQTQILQFMSFIEELPPTAEKAKLMTDYFNCITEKDETTIDVEAEGIFKEEKIPELLTIKECCALIKGLTYYKLRQLVITEKIPSNWKPGQKNGKILINKHDLFEYFNNNKCNIPS